MPACWPPRLAAAVAFAVAVTSAGAGCSPPVDLPAALDVTEISSGFYNNGLKEGKHHLLPSVSFRVRNATDHELDRLQIMVQFRRVGGEVDFGTKLISGVSLDPGGETDLTVVRADAGYTLEDPNLEEFFAHSDFVDFTVRFFARRSGQIVQIAEHQVERRILMQARDTGRP